MLIVELKLSFVGERVCTVAFWKEELLAEIQMMESECDNMTVVILCRIIYSRIFLIDKCGRISQLIY